MPVALGVTVAVSIPFTVSISVSIAVAITVCAMTVMGIGSRNVDCVEGQRGFSQQTRFF
ncbi:MAG TPA: hypothetical protein VJ816_02470 [Gemmatimonadales bacterium]|nr:hypothetical protein [Gemmatimonadales bacterium]